MFETYFSESSGQPTNGHKTHETVLAALTAWRADTGSLFAGSGGVAVLVDDDGDELLRYTEYTEGGCISGSIAEGWVGDDEPDITPAELYDRLRAAVMRGVKLVGEDHSEALELGQINGDQSNYSLEQISTAVANYFDTKDLKVDYEPLDPDNCDPNDNPAYVACLTAADGPWYTCGPNGADVSCVSQAFEFGDWHKSREAAVSAYLAGVAADEATFGHGE